VVVVGARGIALEAAMIVVLMTGPEFLRAPIARNILVGLMRRACLDWATCGV
jgi:hypothetical protein